MSLQCVYKGAAACTGVAAPGAKALMSWFLGAYGPLGGVNSGIYNCRYIAGSTVLSLHAEGRACDLGIRPWSAPYGWTLARALVRHSLALGVQLVIWDGTIWSASRCGDGFRPFNGANPHVDHLHVELTWESARTLTVPAIQAIISGDEDGMMLTDVDIKRIADGVLGRMYREYDPGEDGVRDPVTVSHTIYSTLDTALDTLREVRDLASRYAGSTPSDSDIIRQAVRDVLETTPAIDAVAVAAAIGTNPDLLDAIARGVAARLAGIDGAITLSGTLTGGVRPPTIG